MKRFTLLLLFLAGFVGLMNAQEHRRYALVWHDEFNDGVLDGRVWSKIPRGKADWAIHMSSNDTLFAFDDGDLVLRGMENTFLPKDKAPFLTGGVWSKNKKAFGFGRVEVRARFDVAQGFWPAIWMLSQNNNALNWPHGGEIDIMEHFRDNSYVNNTVHSHYTYNLGRRNRPSHVAYPKYNEGEYNTYSVERFQDSLVFFVNGKRTLNYPRYHNGEDGQFPFSQHDYYLILDAQLGRDRSPYIDTAKLPVELRIDYVRYYEVDTKTDVIPEPKDYQQYTQKRYKFKKIVVDNEKVFDDPDAYHIVTRRGRATISGNVVWAKSTLTQLIGEDGRIANVDFYDEAACSCRGVSLEKYDKKVTLEEMNRLLDVMAFYKLNYLIWNEDGIRSVGDASSLRQHAQDLGITIVSGNSKAIDANTVDLPDASQIFLRPASKTGGWFYLKSLEADNLDAMRAFAERYWRGGDAGEGAENGLPVPISTAGSRWANFMEKLAVHRERFRF